MTIILKNKKLFSISRKEDIIVENFTAMKKSFKFAQKSIFCALLCLLCTSWGFYAHREINKMAVFTLPPELMFFYKKHLDFITEKAVSPDKRRYIISREAPKHYLDVEYYTDSILIKRPDWRQASVLYPQDSMQAHGMLPWNLIRLTYYLKEAFLQQDVKAILKLSADMGHYTGDLHVPLHTTRNYNGQLTGQHGIHGLWESRLPELYAASRYDFYQGRADYIQDIHKVVWDALTESRNAVDSVLMFERTIHNVFREDKIYSYEDRNGKTVLVYSAAYCEAYHKALHHMVERRMRAAIKMTGDLWYTCWVNAGSPDLKLLGEPLLTEQEIKEDEKERLQDGVEGCVH